jgi:hypothetical protein
MKELKSLKARVERFEMEIQIKDRERKKKDFMLL